MRRQLFLLHLRRSVTNVVIVFVAVAAVIYLVERITLARAGQGAEQVPEVVNVILVTGLLLGAFPMGSSAFGKSFREQQALFLYSLPVRRIETWAILVAASATSYLLLLATAAAVRPSLIGTAFEGAAARDIGSGAALAAVFFAGGTCLGLAAPRQAVAIASGLLLVGPSIGLIALINADRFGPSTAAADDALLGGMGIPAGILLLTTIFLLLSAFFYVRGEHELLSQVVLRYVLVVGAILLACATLFAGGALADRRAPMRATSFDAMLSPRGDRLAVVERNRSLRHKQLRVFDVGTGRELFRRRSSILTAGWSGEDSLVVIDSNASAARFVLPLPFTTKATFLRPDGTVAAMREVPNATDASLVTAGRMDESPTNDPILVLESWRGTKPRFHVYGVRNAALQPIGSGDGGIWSTPIFVDGKRVLGSAAEGVVRFFRASDSLDELRWSARPDPGSRRDFFLLDELLYPTVESALSALSTSYPIDGALEEAIRNGAMGGYLVARHGYSLVALNPVRYFVRGPQGSIWEWRERGWILLTDSVEMPKRRESVSDRIISLPSTAAAAPDGTILLTRHHGETTEVLVASAEGERLLGRVNLPDAGIWAGWARREPPALVSVVLSTPARTLTLFTDLARNAVVATAPRTAVDGHTLFVGPDGSRVGIYAVFDDDSAGPPPPGPVELVAKRLSYMLVEIGPDGTRRETKLGE